jgi:hypothetical protein
MKRIFWGLGLLLLAMFFLVAWKSISQDTVFTGKTHFDGPVSYDSKTVSDAGPTDDVDVEGVNIVFIDTSSNNVTIGGFVNGHKGQELLVAITDATNNATIENNEGGGDQDIFLSSGGDEATDTAYGGWNLVCDGSDWYEVEQ